MTRIQAPQHHFPQKSFFRHSHNMVRSAEERFAMERMVTRGFGAKKIATAVGVPEATTKRWLRRWRHANAWVCRLKACVAAKGGFSKVDRGTSQLCRSKTQRKTRDQHGTDTPWHAPQTPTAPQTQTTHPAVLSRVPATKMSTSLKKKP